MEIEKQVTEDQINIDEEFEQFVSSLTELNSTDKCAYLIDELRSDNHNIRLYCIKNVGKISEKLGPERTEEELLPMIIDILMGKEDEQDILIELGNRLYDLSKGLITMRGLEILAGNDDEAVRLNATDRLSDLISDLDENSVNLDIFPLMKRLIDSDLKSKISCCYLFPVVYPRLLNVVLKNQLLQAFIEISKEDAPSVRRAVAFNIRKFTDHKLYINSDEDISKVIKQILPLQISMLKDSVDIVKAVAIESSGILVKSFSDEDRVKLIKQLIEILEVEKSWRVRHAGASAICFFSEFYDSPFVVQNILPLVISFMKDTEPEVKVAILSHIELIIKQIDPVIVDSQLLPLFKDMILNDSNSHVRALFLNKLFLLAKYIDFENYLNNLFPLIKKMIKEDSFEVKVNALYHVEELHKFFYEDDKSDVMIELRKNSIEVFNLLSKDIKWRIRLTLVEQLKMFCELLPLSSIISFVWSFISGFYNDNAFQIREEALNCIIIILNKTSESEFDFNNFFREKLFSLIQSHSKSTNYILRICAIQTIEKLLCKTKIINEMFELKSLPDNKVNDYSSISNSKLILSLLLSFKEDKVPNVRFALANSIKSFVCFRKNDKSDIVNNSTFIEKFVLDEINRVLIELKADVDYDVSYFATLAYDEIRNKV